MAPQGSTGRNRRGGCHAWTTAKSGLREFEVGKRYGTVSVKKFEKAGDAKHRGFFTVNVHVLMYFLYTGELPKSRCESISHLCSNSRCVRLTHLTCEPQRVNLERAKCKDKGSCSHHPPSYKDCIIIKVRLIFFIEFNSFIESR